MVNSWDQNTDWIMQTIISYDFFSLPNCGSFLDLSGLHVSAFSALLVPVSCGGENVADLFFKFHD